MAYPRSRNRKHIHTRRQSRKENVRAGLAISSLWTTIFGKIPRYIHRHYTLRFCFCCFVFFLFYQRDRRCFGCYRRERERTRTIYSQREQEEGKGFYLFLFFIFHFKEKKKKRTTTKKKPSQLSTHKAPVMSRNPTPAELSLLTRNISIYFIFERNKYKKESGKKRGGLPQCVLYVCVCERVLYSASEFGSGY